jgi:DNA-binding FadR family transcriptional regulator
VDAVIQRKPAQARKAVIRHVDFVGEQLRKTIESNNPTP